MKTMISSKRLALAKVDHELIEGI